MNLQLLLQHHSVANITDVLAEGRVFLNLSIYSTDNVLNWTIIGCDTSCAQAITKNMLGIDTTEELNEEDICDCLGEVANMVMGSVKGRLQDNFGDVKVSIPSVVTGRQLQSDLGLGATKLSIQVNIDSQYPAMFALSYRETL